MEWYQYRYQYGYQYRYQYPIYLQCFTFYIYWTWHWAIHQCEICVEKLGKMSDSANYRNVNIEPDRWRQKSDNLFNLRTLMNTVGKEKLELRDSKLIRSSRSNMIDKLVAGINIKTTPPPPSADNYYQRWLALNSMQVEEPMRMLQ